MPRHSSHILELARKGAEARYRELVLEAKGLVEAFPHLRDAFDAGELPIAFILKRGAQRATATASTESSAPRRRRRVSAAARRKMSEARKKYWAERRAGRKK